MMDEYLDQYFSSSSWSDVIANENSSWDYTEPVQQNQLLPNSLGLYEEGEENSPVSFISANHTMDSLAAYDRSSFVLGVEPEYGIDKNLLSKEARHEKDKENSNGNGNLSSNGKMNGSLKLGNVGLQFDTPIPARDSVNLGSPKQLPLVCDMTSSFSLIDSGYVGGSSDELSEIKRSLPDLQTLSPSTEVWHLPSYEEVSSLSSVMGQERTQGFCLRANINNDIDTIGNIHLGMDKILQFDNLSASIIAKGKQEIQSHPLSYFSAGPQTTTTEGLPSLQQTAPGTPTGGCNGTGKPRARARRGQATDPHSIAERLRREKIAEKMRNLQELVPNSNKTDKASMLDEIIDYVKFLQLQVKVLSMSRLGATGTVLPLITDGQAKGSNGFSVSPQADQGVNIFLSPDQVAFEEEVVKLMESNVTMAMQYLQSKGLCLMPIALAAAISSGKASSSDKASEVQKKLGCSNSRIQNSSSSSSSNSSLHDDGINQSLHSNIIIGKPIKESIIANGCIGAVKQEVRNTFCTARELKPKS